MLRKLLFTLAVIVSANALVLAQSGTLKGKIKDKTTGEGIPFANIVIESGGRQTGGTTTDFDGNYTIKPINPGKYDVKATFVGYKPLQISGVVIKSENITFLDVDMESTSITMDEFTVVDYAIPLIDKDGGSKESMDSKQISKMPGRSVDAVVSTMGGVFTDNSGNTSVRGSRTDATVTYVDGVKVMGKANLPASSIEAISVMTGGLPAQYGDATGGIINITTKGPSKDWSGGLEILTSQFIDKFGYNLLGFSVQGPLLMVKDKNDSTKKNPLFGFFLSGEVLSQKDNDPSAYGIWKANDQSLANITAHPYVTAGAAGGVFNTGEYLRKSDMVNIKCKENVANKSASLSAKIDVKSSKNTNLTFGGSFSYSRGNAYIWEYTMLNSKNNPQVTSGDYRIFGRFTQKFSNSTDEKAKKQLIKNIYYSIQADYSKQFGGNQDPNLKDNLFAYGHVGKFKTTKVRSYELGSDSINGLPISNVYVQNAFADRSIVFDPSTYNPDLANYTSYIFDTYSTEFNPITNSSQVLNYQGLLNGSVPKNIYGIYYNVGTRYDSYSKYDNSQIGFNANASADIGNHAISFGFQYEQRVDRSITYSPVALWNVMRQSINFHIQELDTDNPYPIYDASGYFQDTINYERLINLGSQTSIDYNFRKKLGLDVNGRDWIDVDSYDPSEFSIDMFSPEELFNGGGNNALVTYYGYDYTGKMLNKKPSFDDFFTEKDERGVYKREIGAYEPIYIAGYIQDKFAFNDLIFNVGLRVDRFDANQKVLKDQYSLFETVKAGETKLGDVPSSIGSDYVVYVNDLKNPTAITGYRDGSTWYNANGEQITDFNLISTGSGIAPQLVDPNNSLLSSKAFKDYEPQVNFLPRISFSFPISDEALFFAHYDILTKRPLGGVRLNPVDYLYIYSMGTNPINNPDLKPEKTIDYELGFQQVLSKASSLKISAYYREMRDQVQAVGIYGAYPVSYTTYGNIDFGTTKGLTISYDLRQTKNIWFKASYSLQFADGTGSNAGSALALVRAGLPNLRTVGPLSYDRRHALSAIVDFRYSSGKDYNGPKFTKVKKNADGEEVAKTIEVFANTGINTTFGYNSGTPYSRQSNISQRATIIPDATSTLKGQVNGSRLQGSFRIDTKIDRDIYLTLGKKDGKKGKDVYLNVYLQILNVLDSRNITYVYRATGNPNDDGYLAAAQYQNDIKNQTDEQSFRDIYSVAVNDPSNYTTPRTIRLGIQLNF
ncbi:MAG: TonB-dependent receptor [Bacteroidota bacterium]